MIQKNIHGFTLVEMMISLTLLSLITVIGYQGLMFSVTQWRNGNDKMLFQYDYNQAASWIRNRIGTSEIVKFPGGSDYAYFFTGKTNSIEFVARYSRTRRGGLYVNKITFDENDKNIYVSYYLHHPDIKVTNENFVPEQVTLLSNVKSLKFSYFGARKGKTAGWHNSWGNANSFPQLVKLEIESDEGELFQSTILVVTSNNA